MADSRLRNLERLAATGDAQAQAQLDRETQRVGRVDPQTNPLLAYEGELVIVIPSRSPTSERWGEHQRGSAHIGDMIPIPATIQPEEVSGSADALYVSNRASVFANYGGVCCAESIAEPEGCHCSGPCIYCASNGPGWDERDPSGCSYCKGTGQRIPASSDPCSWLVESDLLGGGLLVKVLPEPCGCREDDDPWVCEREILESINALHDYPLLDECLYSRAEMHIQMEDWRDYAASDFQRTLEGTWGDPHPAVSGLDLDGVDWDALIWGWGDNSPTEGLASIHGIYPEGSGDIHWPYETWAEHITRELLIQHGATEEEATDEDA